MRFQVSEVPRDSFRGQQCLPCPTGNEAPLAVDDAFRVPRDVPLTGSLSGNDLPGSNGGNVYTQVMPPAHGTVTISPDGTFTFTPAANYTGAGQGPLLPLFGAQR
jgi:hypothetical protein